MGVTEVEQCSIEFEQSPVFLNMASAILKDGNLSDDERDKILGLQESYRWACNHLFATTQTETGELRDEIDTKEEIITAVKQHPKYKLALQEVMKLSTVEVIHLQKVVGVWVDGIFGPNTFMNYMDSRFEAVGLSITDIARGMEVGNIPNTLKKLADLIGPYPEVIESIGLQPGDFIVYDGDTGNLKIMRWGEKLVQIISIQDSIAFKIRTSIENGDTKALLAMIRNITQKLPEERKKFVAYMQQEILTFHLYPQVRHLFTSRVRGAYHIDFQHATFNALLTAGDLFWNETYLERRGIVYINDGTGNFYSKSKKRLSLTTGDTVQVLTNEQVDQKVQYIPDQKERLSDEPLSDHLWKFVIGQVGRKKAKGECGAGVWDLLTGFGIKGLPQSGRNAYLYEQWLNERPNQFTKVAISHPSEAKPGGILVYGQNASYGSEDRMVYGHVEIKGADGNYYYDGMRREPGGSSLDKYGADPKNKVKNQWLDEADKKLQKNPAEFTRVTGFTWYVYYPVRKEA